jgi:lysophospholipase L1-like esterase
MQKIFAGVAAALTLFSFSVFSTSVSAQEASTVGQGLRDVNGDGRVTIATFGDSLTFGIGDGIAPGTELDVIPPGTGGRGYPARLSQLLGVPVSNGGVPGEEFLVDGRLRFPSVVVGRKPDYIIFLEGSNDAVRRIPRGEYARELQRVINVAKAEGVEFIPLTIPSPVGVHSGQAPFADAFSTAVSELAFVNDLPLADVARAWRGGCTSLQTCRYYTIPEGLHPNTLGYTVISQVVASALLGIDIFSISGAADLEAALGLNPGDVVVQPDVGATEGGAA